MVRAWPYVDLGDQERLFDVFMWQICCMLILLAAISISKHSVSWQGSPFFHF